MIIDVGLGDLGRQVDGATGSLALPRAVDLHPPAPRVVVDGVADPLHDVVE